MSETPPAPRRGIRWGRLLAGIALAVLAVIAIVLGAGASYVGTLASTRDPVADLRTPGTATFTAEARPYDVIARRERRISDRSASSVRCDVTLADGTRRRIDGSRQAVREQVGGNTSVGALDAVAGPTTIACAADGGTIRVQVVEPAGASRLARWLQLAGAALALAATALILTAVLRRRGG